MIRDGNLMNLSRTLFVASAAFMSCGMHTRKGLRAGPEATNAEASSR